MISNYVTGRMYWHERAKNVELTERHEAETVAYRRNEYQFNRRVAEKLGLKAPPKPSEFAQ